MKNQKTSNIPEMLSQDPLRSITEFRTIPLELELENFNPRYRPMHFGSGENIFPLVPRRHIRNEFLAKGITQVIAKIFIPSAQSQDKDFDFPLPSEIPTVSDNIHRFLEIPTTKTARVVGSNRPDACLEGEANYRSHPVYDPYSIWVMDVSCKGKGRQNLDKLRTARIMKEIYKVQSLMHIHTMKAYKNWYQIRKDLESQEGFMKHLEHYKDHDDPFLPPKENSHMANLVWNLKEDTLALENLKFGPSINRMVMKHASLFHNTDKKGFAKLDDKHKEFFLEYVKSLKGWDPKKPQFLQVDIRQNPFPKDGEFCPITDFLEKEKENAEAPCYEVTDSQSREHRSPELSKSKFSANSMRSLFHWDPDSKAPLKLILQQVSRQIVKTRKDEDDLPIYLSKSPGFNSVATFQNKNLSDPSKELIKVFQDFTKEVSEFVSQDEELSKNPENANDLEALQKYVHPMLPRAWRSKAKEPWYVSLEHAMHLDNNWNTMQNHYTGIHQGMLPGVLRQKHRAKYAELLVRTTLENLSWPVPSCYFENLEKENPEFAKLKESYTQKFTQALRDFVAAMTPSEEIGRIAASDPVFEYSILCDFLEKRPDLIPVARLSRNTISILSETHADNPEDHFLDSINEKLPLAEAPVTNAEMLKRFGTDEEVNIETIGTYLLPSSPMMKEPRAKVRKYLRSLPVMAHFNPESRDPKYETSEFPCSRHEIEFMLMHLVRLDTYLCSLPLDLMPENPAEWSIFYHLTWHSPSSGDVLMGRNFWPNIVRRIRKAHADAKARDFRDASNEEPGGLDFNHWGLDMDLFLADQNANYWNKDWENTKETLKKSCFHRETSDLILVLKEVAEFSKSLEETLRKFQKCKMADLKECPEIVAWGIPEFLVAANQAVGQISRISSQKKAKKISRRWGLNAPKIPEIERQACVWPLKLDAELFSWKPAILKDMLSEDRKLKARELDSEHAVKDHGKRMGHCIASYTSHCIRETKNEHIVECLDNITGESIATATIKETAPDYYDDKPPTFEIREHAGVSNTRTPDEAMTLFKRVNHMMWKNAVDGKYKWKKAREHRSRMERLWNNRKEASPIQEFWMYQEQWRVLQTINEDLPKFPEISQDDLEAAYRNLAEKDPDLRERFSAMENLKEIDGENRRSLED